MDLLLTDKKGAAIDTHMVGLFFEDINFAADGGLYAEMIENRSFEAREAFGTPDRFYMTDDPGYAWSPFAPAGTDQPPRLLFVTGMPLSEANPHYLHLTTYAPCQGFGNKAYDGLCLQKGMTYHVSFYARCVDYEGSFTVRALLGNETLAKASVPALPILPNFPFADTAMPLPEETGNPFLDAMRAVRSIDKTGRVQCHEWVRYELDLTAEADARGALFAVTLDQAGTVDFDLISMIPADAVDGVFRKDLFEVLAGLRPGFIRFPGGCIVEGISLANRYRWKNTVGPLKDRRYTQNLWAFDDERTHGPDSQRKDSHYGQSYGIGFYEYFRLCELLGAKPLPVLNIGLACQFRTTEKAAISDPAFREYIGDALDLIEFANGPVDSRWGSLRAEMGHPAPFGLDMIAIGNEQWATDTVDLYDRHRLFEEAIHAVYPDMKLLGTAGPNVAMPLADEAWQFYRDGEAAKPGFCYAVDEHYYASPEWLYENEDLYDAYPRHVAVFAGEYAAHDKDKANSMESALAEAAMMTGMERNGDVVKLASYAPLFNRIGHSQWHPDMIWFDAEKVLLTPNYHVQRLFSEYAGDHVLPLGDQVRRLREKGIHASLVSAEGSIILKAVNTGSEDFPLTLKSADGAPLTGKAELHVLISAGAAEGDLPEPASVTDSTADLSGLILLPARSVAVICIPS